jgi:hypothetical protein
MASKSIQCGFESHPGHFPFMIMNGFRPTARVTVHDHVPPHVFCGLIDSQVCARNLDGEATLDLSVARAIIAACTMLSCAAKPMY